MEVLNDLLNYNGLKIYQDNDSFCFSLDSVILANFVTINKNSKNILDLGCGNAAIPLILSTKTNAQIIGVELQTCIYDLAIKSVKYNKLTSQIKILNEDINNLHNVFTSESFDVIISNPPYFKVGAQSKFNDSPTKMLARHEIKLTFEELVKQSSFLLRENGIFAFVHRPDRLIEFIETLKKYHLEPKRIRYVYPSESKEANMILVEASKGGKTGLKVLPPLFAHNDKGYSDEIIEMFNGKKE